MKDRALNKGEIQLLQSEYRRGYNQSVLDNDNWGRDTYGYEIGKSAGIREAVEWIEKEFGYFTDEGLAKIIVDDGGYYGEEGSIKKYQAQKRKWGIKNEKT